MFSYQQVVTPPAGAGAPALDKDYRFGTSVVASRSRATSVLTGTNLFVGAPFGVFKERGDEAVYFYSAAVETEGLTRTDYLLVQTLTLQTSISSNFGSAMALSPDDSTIIVGAPGYSTLAPTDRAYNLAGPLSGKAYVFQWNKGGGSQGTGAYTMQAILTPPAAALAGEVGFGVAVAMSGDIFAVASIGAADITGQDNPSTGRLYIWKLGAPTAVGATGAVSALSVPRFIQFINNVPVSNALALSMAGDYISVGVQMRAQVLVLLNKNARTFAALPDYDGQGQRTIISASSTAGSNTGMGQIVTSRLVQGQLYLYCGQPNANTGQVYISQNSFSLVFTSFGVAGGLLPGFGSSMVFNNDGNYMFAGNFLNQPHALVLSIYFEGLGAKAVDQRLISNDAQTAGAGVYSNYGTVVTSCSSSIASIVAIGASLGPTSDGRLYIYTLRQSSGQFSLQAVLGGTASSNFGASAKVMVIGSNIGIVVGAPNLQNGYVNVYIATNQDNLGGTTSPYQQLNAPPCTPDTRAFSCGSNFGGSVGIDGQTIVVGAHNFGVQPGTGRVYVYMPGTDYGGNQNRKMRFSLQQILVSPAAEYGFGVGIALSRLTQNAHTRPLPGAQSTFNIIVIVSMGQPREMNDRFPYTMPNNVGACYIYARVGRSFSPLQVLLNVPVPLQTSVVGTGSVQAVATSQRNLYIGSVWRNLVYVYRYDGIKQYTQLQIIHSPYCSSQSACQFGGAFGSSIFANPGNNGLAIGAPLNGSVYFYSAGNGQPFSLIRAVSAQPNADLFGSALDFAAARFIVGAPGANVAGVYKENGLMALPQAQPSPAPNGIGRKLGKSSSTKTYKKSVTTDKNKAQ